MTSHRIVLTVGLALMNLCWIAPWALLVGWWADLAHPRPLLSGLSILALGLGGALTALVLGRQAARSRPARVMVMGLGVLGVLVAIRVDQYPGSGALDWLGRLVTALPAAIGAPTGPALAFALGLFVWWRGIRLGSQTPTYPDVEGTFKWGLGLLIAFALVTSLTTRQSLLPALEAQTTPFVVGFFFVSLLTLALGRLESLRTRTRGLAINGQWFGVLVVVAGMTVLAALLMGQLLSFDLLLIATRPLFDALGWILLVLIYIVVIPLAYVVELLVYAVLALLRANAGQRPPEPHSPSDIDEALQRLFSLDIPPGLELALKAAAAAILIAVGLLIIARAAARWRPSSADADAAGEERDSLWEPGRLRALLMGWLRRLFGRDRRGTAATPADSAAGGMTEQLAGVGSIRELYRGLLRLGESAGARRAAATTPFEHVPALQHRLQPEDAVAALTEAYVKVRYAEQEPPPSTAASLRAELDRVTPSTSGRGLIKG